jgi:choline-sulfatase
VPLQRLSLALLCGFAALAGVACTRTPPPPQRIVLVTIDTLRADHLGVYGYPRDTSPFLDRLASEGVLFERAFAPISTTVPSHAALFTSAYPAELAVLKNGHRLADSHTTLAERLGARGFTTAAFVSLATHFRPGGLDQGFAHFDVPTARDARSGAQTVQAAGRWLAARPREERLFLWVHLFDPHWPYRPPAKFHDPFRRAPRKVRQDFLRFLQESHHLDLGFFGGPRETLRTIDAYDGEVRAADHALEELFASVGASGAVEDTLWIVTSDHGEGLGNHHFLDHGKNIYNEQLRVPLIVHGARWAERPRRVAEVVELVDVVPTVFALLGGEEAGSEAWRGSSLVPLLAGGDGFRAKRAFAQRRHFDATDPDDEAWRKSGNYEEGDTWALQDVGFKYLHRTAGGSELFDLAADPYETHNLLGQGRREELELRRSLLARLAEQQRSPGEGPELVAPEEIEALRSLGYVQ